MVLTVYGRMFSLWMYAAISPIPLSAFAGEPTSSVGKNFLRSYAGVCLQGVVIALACICLLYTSCGTVLAVDDAGQLLMQWDNGCSLSLLPGVDSFEVLERPKHRNTPARNTCSKGDAR